MKGRACCLTCIALILLVSLTACAAQVTWAKYVSQDGSFSFHYPKGWQVKENESVIVLEGEDSGEDVYFFALPHEHTWSAEEHARFMLSALQAENPGLEAYGWESDSESETVLFSLAYGSGAHSYELGAYAEGMRNYQGENVNGLKWIPMLHPSNSSRARLRALAVFSRCSNTLSAICRASGPLIQPLASSQFLWKLSASRSKLVLNQGNLDRSFSRFAAPGRSSAVRSADRL